MGVVLLGLKVIFDGGNMKKVIAGLGFLLSGTLLYLVACLVGSYNLQYTTEWRTSIGRFWQSVINSGMMPAVVIGIIFISVGVIFAIWGVFEKGDTIRK